MKANGIVALAVRELTECLFWLYLMLTWIMIVTASTGLYSTQLDSVLIYTVEAVMSPLSITQICSKYISTKPILLISSHIAAFIVQCLPYILNATNCSKQKPTYPKPRHINIGSNQKPIFGLFVFGCTNEKHFCV